MLFMKQAVWVGLLVGLLAISSFGQITRWDTGEVISGTEGITPGPNLYFNSWNQDEHNLQYADFSGGLDLNACSFHSCWMDNARFNNANLSGRAYFTNSSLVNAVFDGSTLDNAWLSHADLTSSSFRNADISNARIQSCDGFTSSQLFSTANYQPGRLRDVNVLDNDMSGWDFANLDIGGCVLSGYMAGADFSGAVVADASIGGVLDKPGTGITKEQLFSTQSYQAGDLHGVGLTFCELSGCDFSNKNMRKASFAGSNLTGANFTNALLEEVRFGSFVQGTDLSNACFCGANLAGANFEDIAGVAGADFSGSIIEGACFSWDQSIGLGAEQMYSTASYQKHDLHAIHFFRGDLSGWDFANQYLVDSEFEVMNLFSTDFSGADLRNVRFLISPLSESFLNNTILPDGQINGLRLDSELLIRDYVGDFVITVEDEMVLSEEGKLSIMLEDDDWNSLILIADDAAVNLDGTLYLGFAEGADLDAMLGTTYTIFNWNGALPDGEFFADVAWDEGVEWDVSNLYTLGTVTLTGIPEPCTLGLLVLGGSLLARKRRF